MERVQFFPGERLGKALKDDAKAKKIPVSQLVIEILMKHYTLIQNERPLKEVTTDVLQEIKEYVESHETGTIFDILTASKSFAEIEMIAAGKPSANRASVGRTFAALVGKNEFQNVIVAEKDGVILRSPNHATMYKIISVDKNEPRDDE